MMLALAIAQAIVAATPSLPPPHVSMAPGYPVPLPTVPGVDNPAVTQATIGQTICNKTKYDRHGKPDPHGFTWVHWQRPPTAYTNKIKFALMDAQGIPRADARQFELDHEMSIEDGGDPSSPLNLWLQPYRGKYCSKWCSQDKDQLETLLKRLVCKGTISLDEARHELQTDWVAAWLERIGNANEVGKKGIPK